MRLPEKDSFEREMLPITDGNGHVVRWICRDCSWSHAPTPTLKPNDLKMLYVTFDGHRCIDHNRSDGAKSA